MSMETNPVSYLNRKMVGFNFAEISSLRYQTEMDECIGVDGKIIEDKDGVFLVDFGFVTWHYPKSKAIEHLVPETNLEKINRLAGGKISGWAEKAKKRAEEDISKLSSSEKPDSLKPYFHLHKNEGGRMWLFYKPDNDGRYSCWEPIDQKFWDEFETLLSAESQLSSKEARIKELEEKIEFNEKHNDSWNGWKSLKKRQEDMKTDNELIAEFMGTREHNGWIHINERRYGIQKKYYPQNLRYKTSWDWLMPVVEKIRLLMYEIDIDATAWRRVSNLGIFAKLPDVYKAVVEFIKWYNQNKEAK